MTDYMLDMEASRSYAESDREDRFKAYLEAAPRKFVFDPDFREESWETKEEAMAFLEKQLVEMYQKPNDEWEVL